MNAENKTKINNIIWPSIYFILAIVLSVSIAIAANKTGYTRIFVSGQSMVPTLDGGPHSGGAQEGDVVDFGYMDPSSQAINNLKRFNIVTTYFPYNWQNADYDKDGKLLSTASYKIKRIIGLPGEKVTLHVDLDKTCHITISKGKNSTTYTYDDDEKGWNALLPNNVNHLYKYEIHHFSVNKMTSSKNYSTTLGDDEYFVMGDNWDVSSDSSTNMDPESIMFMHRNHIKRNNLQGVLIAIEGKATIIVDEKTHQKTVDNLIYGDTKYFYTEL